MLRRLLRYCDKNYRIDTLLGDVRDTRRRPIIPLRAILQSGLVMALTRMGSLNALEQTRQRGYWRRWIGGALPSADSIGRVCAQVNPDDIRNIIREMYTRLKRNKAIRPVYGKFYAIVIDGHEPNASYVRCCPKCLLRGIQTNQGEIVQFYHRYVMAQLLCGSFSMCLDMEPQRPGEDEIAAALRLIERLCKTMPRAFNLILGDGLYARANVFKEALRRRKHVIAVLKDERRELLQDVRGIMKKEPPVTFTDKNGCKHVCWDIENLTTWSTLPVEARVVYSVETTVATSPDTKRKEEKTSEWAWATDVPQKELPTQEFVPIAHARWKIENNGFNELVNQWRADHVYKHEAMDVFWLITMLAYNFFHAFIFLNLKPQIRKNHTKLHWAARMATELYASLYLGYCPSDSS